MSDKPKPKASKVSVTAAPPPPPGGATGAQPAASSVDLSHADVAPGRKIGKYVIHRPLGKGGMGVVYEATDGPLQRKVALKILPHEFSSDDQALQRFIREARMAARLNHPNAVAVYEIGRKGNVYFIAMELVNGASAQEMLAGGKKLAWRQATRAIIDACRGLSAAHAAGMIHRDIKPSNLLWTESGSVKVSDFGLAKPHSNAENLSVTRRDQFVGTPLFMSPEQCRNDAVDNRSDIYSLGATYYMLLSGRAPYEEGSAIQILFAHCSAPIPDVTAADPDVPPMAAHVIRKAMAKRPEDRYQSVDEMLSDLETVLDTPADEQASLVAAMSDEGEGIAAPPMMPTEPPGLAVNWPWVIGGGVVVITVLVGIVITLLMARSDGEPAAVAATAPPTKVAPPAVIALPALPVEVEKPAVDTPAPVKVVEPVVVARELVATTVPVAATTTAPAVVASEPAVPPVAAPATSPAVAMGWRPEGEGPREAAAVPAGEPASPVGAGPERNFGAGVDPALREFARARIYAEAALKGNDPAKKLSAAQAMVLWNDFFTGSPRPAHKTLATVSKNLANKLSPGIEAMHPRVQPVVDGLPLPPHGPEMDRSGPGAPGEDRPQPPPRERRPQRR